MNKYFNTSNEYLKSNVCSNIVINNNTAYLCGQICINPNTGELMRNSFKEQAVTSFNNVKLLLEEAGSGLDKVCMCNVYLSSMKHFDEMNEIYNEFFTGDKPARVTVAVSEIWENLDIEVSVVASI